MPRKLLPLVAVGLLVAAYGGRRLYKRYLRSSDLPVFVPVAIAASPVRPNHPRLLLDPQVLARLKQAAAQSQPIWQQLRKNCDQVASEAIRSGYEAWDWSEAMADLALCWHATKQQKYSDAAIRYLQALLDDRQIIGDGQGGHNVVEHDSGYPIRSYGVYAALGYDWLHDAPGMTPALRQKIAGRLVTWLNWYKEKGYQRTSPISNYFCGYLAAAAFAALGMAGEVPQADGWLTYVREDLLSKLVLPQYTTRLAGGDFPEGWQYGELSAASIALVLDAFRTATGTPLGKQLPWLGQVVTHHVHALLPSGDRVYDSGDWSERPTKASALALNAILFALEGIGEHQRAAEARWMVKNVLPPIGREQFWVQVLAWTRPGAERDPRLGSPTSLHMPGTGLSFFRSEWSGQAVWTSLQAGPPMCDGHQHADQGHFELWRGGDGLLVDGGDYGAGSTMSHNSILIDDGGRVLNYPPNQGMWGKSIRTTRFFDGGSFATATGDLTEAYFPNCAPDGCKKRVAQKVLRHLVFVRPAVVVLLDRIILEDGTDSVVWAAHTTTAPMAKGTLASATVGGSRVDVRTLVPSTGTWVVRKEPTTPADENPWTRNKPWGPMWRIEMASPRGAPERRFVHVVTANGADDGHIAAQALGGRSFEGARTVQGGKSTDVLLADDEKGGDVAVPVGSQSLVLIGLKPAGRYDLRTALQAANCQITLKSAPEGKRTASAGGTLSVGMQGCQVQ